MTKLNNDEIEKLLVKDMPILNSLLLAYHRDGIGYSEWLNDIKEELLIDFIRARLALHGGPEEIKKDLCLEELSEKRFDAIKRDYFATLLRLKCFGDGTVRSNGNIYFADGTEEELKDEKNIVTSILSVAIDLELAKRGGGLTYTVLMEDNNLWKSSGSIKVEPTDTEKGRRTKKMLDKHIK